MQRTKSQNLEKIFAKDRAQSMMSHYETIEHPNEVDDEKDEDEQDPNEPFSWPKSSFVKWFLKYDESHLRPFFIRKYNRAVQILQDEHQELIQMQFADDDSDEIAEKVEKLYETVRNATPNQRSISENILQPFLARDNSMKKRTASAAPNKAADFLGAGEKVRKSDDLPGGNEPLIRQPTGKF